MEFVIPDESFDNSNDPLQVQASLYSSILYYLCTDSTGTAKLQIINIARLFYYGQNPQTHIHIHRFNKAYRIFKEKKSSLSFIFRVHIWKVNQVNEQHSSVW